MEFIFTRRKHLIVSYRLTRDIIIPDHRNRLYQVVRVEVPVLEDFQVLPVVIHLEVRPVVPVYQEVNPVGNLVVIHLADHRAFQVDVQEVLNQADNNPEGFHLDKDRLVDIQADDPRFRFRAVNQPVVDILVADLVAKDQVAKDQAEDIPVDRLLEVIPVEHKSLVAREVDILVEGQAQAIQEVLKDLVVVQVLRDQVDIRDQEHRAALKVLEVSRAQVEQLTVTLVLDLKHQEAIQVDQVRKDHTEKKAFDLIFISAKLIDITSFC